MSVVPDVFGLHVTDTDVDDLRRRLRDTRWPLSWPSTGWEAGTDQAELRRLVAYWADGFDWAAQDRWIRSLPWNSATIDGTTVSYLRFDAEAPGGIPIVLTNGWPSTVLELVTLAQRLATPSLSGGSPETAVTVIVPAIPGLPFSPQRPSLHEQTHELWHRLMKDHLGFERYAAHGGDLGPELPHASQRPTPKPLREFISWPLLARRTLIKRRSATKNKNTCNAWTPGQQQKVLINTNNKLVP